MAFQKFESIITAKFGRINPPMDAVCKDCNNPYSVHSGANCTIISKGE
jgi:hypothetical protein